MSVGELDPFLQLALDAASAGGDVLQEWSEKFSVSAKSPKNLVTEADLNSQKAIESLKPTYQASHSRPRPFSLRIQAVC